MMPKRRNSRIQKLRRWEVEARLDVEMGGHAKVIQFESTGG